MAALLSAASLVLCLGGGFAAEECFAGADGEVCGGRAAGTVSSDHVLLQSHRSSLLSPAQSGLEQAAMSACGACLAAIDAADGCAAMLDSEFIFHHELADFNTECGHCSSEVLTHCSQFLQDGTCDACVSEFEGAGGCDVMKQIMQGTHDNPDANVSGLQHRLVELIPPGCQPCGEDAARHCSADQHFSDADLAACGACVQALGAAGACAAPRGSPWDRVADSTEACTGVGETCQEMFNAYCARKDASADGCRTAVAGDPCFVHVRWAMQVGVSAHPEWYEGLTQDSSFEDFQRHLRLGLGYTCPEPCPAEEKACHTAAPSEECHRHVAWAKEVGVVAVPRWYPDGLTQSSTAEEFQAWLHRIHHGNCPPPCSP